jgi:hypothetical protein
MLGWKSVPSDGPCGSWGRPSASTFGRPLSRCRSRGWKKWGAENGPVLKAACGILRKGWAGKRSHFFLGV